MSTKSLLPFLLAMAVPAVAAAQEGEPPAAEGEATPAAEGEAAPAAESEAAPPAAEGEAAPPAEPPPAEEKKKDEGSPIAMSYKKGVVFASEDGKFELKLALRTQFRFQLDRAGEDGAEFANAFSIPRGRLQLEGHVFGKDLRYKIEFAAADKSQLAFTKDLYLDARLGGNWLRFGQWKQPFNRQEIVSDFGSVFNERANTAGFVKGGRDVGILYHNDYEKSPEGLEWAAGVFQSFAAGTDTPGIGVECEVVDPMTGELACDGGVAARAQKDFGPTLVVRLGWNKGKIKGYSEGDLEGGALRYAVGVSYKVDIAEGVSDEMQHAVGLDAMIKASGFDLFLGVYLIKLAGEDVDAELGGTLQAGYFLTPKKHQVALRGSFIPSSAYDGQALEIRAAYNWFFQGHNWKWATDIGVLTSTGEDEMMGTDEPDLQLRTMAQMSF